MFLAEHERVLQPPSVVEPGTDIPGQIGRTIDGFGFITAPCCQVAIPQRPFRTQANVNKQIFQRQGGVRSVTLTICNTSATTMTVTTNIAGLSCTLMGPNDCCTLTGNIMTVTVRTNLAGTGTLEGTLTLT